MIPKPPPHEGPLGFIYHPPYRVQGTSVAGEATCVQIPELDVCFDMGSCPRAVLASKYAVISHGHMDHVGALAYWCSQRNFQGMGPGTIVCDERIAADVEGMMQGFVNLERQKTPYEIRTLKSHAGGQVGSPEAAPAEIEIKNSIFLRGFHTEHTCESMGYVIVERRSKLKPELEGLPQEKLKELKDRGEEITRILEIPLIAYLGDTQPGPHLIRDDVRRAQIIITECTFFEPDHRERAKIGQHMHVEDIKEWIKVCECEAMVLTHVSRRTNLQYAGGRLNEVLGDDAARVRLLMDHRMNKMIYDHQAAEAERRERELAASGRR